MNKNLVNDKETKRQNISSFLTFRINEQLFALPITAIKDIFETKNITPVQLAPKGILGLLNIRGHIYSVISLRECLGLLPLKLEEEQIFYTLDHEGEKYCLMVDKVGEVLIPEAEKFTEIPCTLEKVYGSLASKIYKLENEILILLDIEKIFTPKKLLPEESAQYA